MATARLSGARFRSTLAPDTVRRCEPADSVFNTESGKGALRPPVTPWIFASVSARRRAGATSRASSPFVPTAVPRRSAKGRSAIAANPSPAILRASARDLSGVEGAEPLVSLFVATRSMLA